MPATATDTVIVATTTPAESAVVTFITGLLPVIEVFCPAPSGVGTPPALVAAAPVSPADEATPSETRLQMVQMPPPPFYISVPDVDALARQAPAAGAEVMEPIADRSFRERTGLLRDPQGNLWMFATKTAKHGGLSG